MKIKIREESKTKIINALSETHPEFSTLDKE